MIGRHRAARDLLRSPVRCNARRDIVSDGFMNEMVMQTRERCLLVTFSLLVRLAIGLGSYSGAGIPPRYGDYEAQRHWMELTVHLPVTEWYRNSSVNDVSHWGLDYPPLSGYQSWLHGKVIQYFDPDAVGLQTSHGYETLRSKLLMRWSVVFSDLLCEHFRTLMRGELIVRLFAVFVPAALWAADVISEQCSWILLLQPCLLLIDHGHFQYNCISLGLTLLSVLSILTHRDNLGSALFVCAFNHKHMSLYFAMAFFGHLLGRCLQQKSLSGKVAKLIVLGGTVVGTMALIWSPYLTSVSSAMEVVHRLTPVARGLYEDYVSNFWCVSSVVIKWRRLLDAASLVRLCGLMTLTASLPSTIHQICRPSPQGFLYALANAALSFYLFSYQVHEKSVLMPALAISLLVEYEAWLIPCFHLAAVFSIFPLLEKDGLSLQYIAVLLLFISFPFISHEAQTMWQKSSLWGLLSCCVVLHALRLSVAAPIPYPFLHDLLLSGFCFLLFLCTSIYLNIRQWSLMSHQQ